MGYFTRLLLKLNEPTLLLFVAYLGGKIGGLW